MSNETLPEYPALVFCGETEDKKAYIFKVGNATREVKKDEESWENFRYTLYRLNRLIKHKRERIAIDSIM